MKTTNNESGNIKVIRRKVSQEEYDIIKNRPSIIAFDDGPYIYSPNTKAFEDTLHESLKTRLVQTKDGLDVPDSIRYKEQRELHDLLFQEILRYYCKGGIGNLKK